MEVASLRHNLKVFLKLIRRRRTVIIQYSIENIQSFEYRKKPSKIFCRKMLKKLLIVYGKVASNAFKSLAVIDL